jgi:hypothetical protein
MDIKQPFMTNNSTQNLGQSQYDRANMVGNLSVENPTIEQLNAALTGAQTPGGTEDGIEPAFGER